MTVRGVVVGALVVAIASTLGCFPARATWDPNPVTGVVTEADHHCGAQDHPETGIQGDVSRADQGSGVARQGYNCGLALVGHATLDNDRDPTGNANMAWAGDCAYVAGPTTAIAPDVPMPAPAKGGVAVVDVHDPAQPAHVRTLRDPGGLASAETINAVTTSDGRSILVVGQYGNTVVGNSPASDSQGATKPTPMDIYDVTADCTQPVLLATYIWPTNIHNLTISPNGRYVFATQPLEAIDISPLWSSPKADPVYLGNLDKAMEGPMFAVGPSADLDDAIPAPAREAQHPSYSSHEAFSSPDGTKLYLGGQLPTFELFTIVDIKDWLQRNSDGTPVGPPRIISQRSGRGHSVRLATINGTKYVLHSEESPFGAGFGCAPETANPFAGPAQPWLTDIGNEADPKLVSQFGLAINDAQNCAAQLEANETDSVHYHDVDNPDDTTFVMASMWNAGIRVFDVRDPVRPKEVAYFNPGDVGEPGSTVLDHAWGHIRYVASTGQIWFATADGGFWVVELERGVRSALGLDAKLQGEDVAVPQTQYPDGRPGTAGVRLDIPLAAVVDVTPYYCTLGATQGLNSPTG
jgi:hypothetical protein